MCDVDLAEYELFDYKICHVKDVSAHDFITAFAQHLKRQGKIEIPKWVDYVKAATFKELAPYDPDWLYVRAASVARKLYIRPGSGVGAFQKMYGGQERRGTRTNHYHKAGAKINRYLLQQLGEIGLVEHCSSGGRQISSEGTRDLDLVAGRVAQQKKEAAEEDE